MNLNPMLQQCDILKRQVGNIEQWVWPKSDSVTFDIILQDWIHTIRPYLESTFGSLSRNGTVVQAGGNCGVYPLLYTEFFKNVITFEPDPLSFFCLVNNCQIPGVVKINAALSDKGENIVMREVAAGNRGMNKVDSVDGESSQTELEVIPAIALDSMKYIDLKLIQLDLEGYEIKAIDGAINTIREHKPVIILECGNDKDAENIPYHNQVVDKMATIGYKKIKQLNRLDVIFAPN